MMNATTPFTPDRHMPSRAESLLRVARLAQPDNAAAFDAAINLLTAFVLLCRQEGQDPVKTASWVMPVIAKTVDNHVADQTEQAEAATAITCRGPGHA